MNTKETKLNIIQAGQLAIKNSKKDFNLLIKSLNLNLDVLNAWADSPEYDKIAGAVEDDKNKNYKVKNSQIHGKGIFANKYIKKNSIIGYALKNKKRTYLGKYTNHSPFYNSKFFDKKDGLETIMIASKNINKNEEILVDYRNQIFNREFYK